MDAQQKRAEMKGNQKNYEDDQSVKVLDPAGFNTSQESQLFSGPQSGEKLPSLAVTGIDGEIDGKTFDITAMADEKASRVILTGYQCGRHKRACWSFKVASYY